MEIGQIRRCLKTLKFSGHALKEMLAEEFGEIAETEVKEVLARGEIIENYPQDRPIPSCLIYGQTSKGRPLHIVCAPLISEETLVIITVYEPDPERWINFRRRK